jgi:hypothetical protein
MLVFPSECNVSTCRGLSGIDAFSGNMRTPVRGARDA